MPVQVEPLEVRTLLTILTPAGIPTYNINNSDNPELWGVSRFSFNYSAGSSQQVIGDLNGIISNTPRNPSVLNYVLDQSAPYNSTGRGMSYSFDYGVSTSVAIGAENGELVGDRRMFVASLFAEANSGKVHPDGQATISASASVSAGAGGQSLGGFSNEGMAKIFVGTIGESFDLSFNVSGSATGMWGPGTNDISYADVSANFVVNELYVDYSSSYLGVYEADSDKYDIDFAYYAETFYVNEFGALEDTSIRFYWIDGEIDGQRELAYEYELNTSERTEDGFHDDIFQLDRADRPGWAKLLEMVIDEQDAVAENDELNNKNSSLLPGVPVITEVQASEDESSNGDNTFGTYIKGIDLPLTMYVYTTVDAELSASAVVKYEIGSGASKVTGTAVRYGGIEDDQQYRIVLSNVGNLPAGDLPLTITLEDGDGLQLNQFTGTFKVIDELAVTFKGRANGDTAAFTSLARLRFLDDVGVVVDIEGRLTELPLRHIYYNKFEWLVREVGVPSSQVHRVNVNFTQAGSVRGVMQDWNTDQEFEAGKEYELVLRARTNPSLIYADDKFVVETVPTWLRDAQGMVMGVYDSSDHRFEFETSVPAQLNNLVFHTTQDTPFGLFDGLETGISAGLVFEAYAGLSLDDEAYAVAREFQANATLLGKSVADTTKPVPGDLRSTLDSRDLTAAELVFRTPEIVLADAVQLVNVSFGKNLTKQFQIKVPKAVLSALGPVGAVASFIDLGGTFQATSKRISIQGTFALDVRDDQLNFVPNKSKVVLKAGASTKVGVTAGAGIDWLANIEGEGTVWADVAGLVTVGINGSLTDPDFSLLSSESYLAAQVGYELSFNWELIGIDFQGQPIRDYGKPKLLLGSKTPPQSLRDDGKFSISGPNVSVDTEAAAPTAAPPQAVAGGSPSILPPNGVEPTVSEIRFDTAIDPYADNVRLMFDVESDVSTLPAGRHQVEIFAVPTDETAATVALGSWDLADYPLVADASSIGHRSSVVTVDAPIGPDDLEPGTSYRLVIRVTNDPASGETVMVRARDLEVSAAEPRLELTAPNAALTDNVINFGTETNGNPYIDLKIRNSGVPLLELADFVFDAPGYAVTGLDDGALQVYGDDLPLTIRIEITDPAVARAATLRFATNDPDNPEVAIQLNLVPARIGNFVWHDVNRNGVQDTGEKGLRVAGGMTVNLYSAGADGMPGGNDDLIVATTKTNKFGVYEFANVVPGRYFMEFVLPAGGYAFAPARVGNWKFDSNADPSNGRSEVFAIAPGETDYTRDAGVFEPGRIGDRVWIDANGNGIQDAGEVGLRIPGGMTVNLYSTGPNSAIGGGDDVLIRTTRTNKWGAYLFEGISGGRYYVQFVLPQAYAFTPRNPSANWKKDSDADPDTGLTAAFNLSQNKTDLSRDAGVVAFPLRLTGGVVD